MKLLLRYILQIMAQRPTLWAINSVAFVAACPFSWRVKIACIWNAHFFFWTAENGCYTAWWQLIRECFLCRAVLGRCNGFKIFLSYPLLVCNGHSRYTIGWCTLIPAWKTVWYCKECTDRWSDQRRVGWLLWQKWNVESQIASDISKDTRCICVTCGICHSREFRIKVRMLRSARYTSWKSKWIGFGRLGFEFLRT